MSVEVAPGVSDDPVLEIGAEEEVEINIDAAAGAPSLEISSAEASTD